MQSLTMNDKLLRKAWGEMSTPIVFPYFFTISTVTNQIINTIFIASELLLHAF